MWLVRLWHVLHSCLWKSPIRIIRKKRRKYISWKKRRKPWQRSVHKTDCRGCLSFLHCYILYYAGQCFVSRWWRGPYSGNAFQISLVEAAWGIGALLGGAFLGMKKFKLNEISLINWMYILLGVTFGLSGILPVSGYPLFVVLTAVGGISGSLYMASFTTVVQTRTIRWWWDVCSRFIWVLVCCLRWSDCWVPDFWRIRSVLEIHL